MIDQGAAEAARIWSTLVAPHRNQLHLYSSREAFGFLASCGALAPALDESSYPEEKFKKCYVESNSTVRRAIVLQLWGRLESSFGGTEWLNAQKLWLDQIYSRYEDRVKLPTVETTRKDVLDALEAARRAVDDGRLDEILLPVTTSLQAYLVEVGRELGVEVKGKPHSDLRKILDFLREDLSQSDWGKQTSEVIHSMQLAVQSIFQGRGEGDKLTHPQRSRSRLDPATYRLFVNATATLLQFMNDLLLAKSASSR